MQCKITYFYTKYWQNADNDGTRTAGQIYERKSKFKKLLQLYFQLLFVELNVAFVARQNQVQINQNVALISNKQQLYHWNYKQYVQSCIANFRKVINWKISFQNLNKRAEQVHCNQRVYRNISLYFFSDDYFPRFSVNWWNMVSLLDKIPRKQQMNTRILKSTSCLITIINL